MRHLLAEPVIILTMLFGFSTQSECIDSLKYCVSFNYYRDLSDTYKGGSLFSAEVGITRSWYGASVSYGFFQSHNVFRYEVVVEGYDRTLTIPFDELSTMSSGSLSLILIPVQNRVVNVNLLLGYAVSKARSLQFHDVEFSYSIQDEKYNYLFKNYELVKATHQGLMIGIDISFSVTMKLGLRASARIQDLSKGGTFFFVGSGIFFRL
jgi:hypothetical protein